VPDEIQPTSIRLPLDLKAALAREAAAERRTVSWLIVEAVRVFVAARKERRREAKS
jgi:predicted transcriptional regulator